MNKFKGHKNSKITILSKDLRNNMTKEERHLWFDFLQNLPVRINRQKVFDNYIVDFYIAEKKTVIEVDGLQHKAPQHKEADEVRDKALSAWGITVLRYSNKDIKQNFNAVAEDILQKLDLSFSDLKNI